MPGRGLQVVVTGDVKGLQRALRSARGELLGFASHAKGVQGTLQRIGGGMQNAGRGMSKMITLPIVGAAAASVKLAATFEKQMSSLGAVLDAPAAKLEQLRKSAIKAGADTKYSAQEAAVAQTELAKGGLDAATILSGGLKGALSLAAAGELELGDAATITANALNLFKLRGSEAGQVADAMATAANATTADVEDFGMALKQGGGVARSAGYSFKETMVILEALAASGVKNSDAGTSMKTALIHLIAPSKKGAEQMAELGLKFTDSAGKMKSLGAISQMLRDRLGGMTKAQRTATLAQIGGTDGVRTLLALYDAGPKKLQQYAKGLDKQGTAADVAKKKQDNLAGKVEQLQGSLETAGIVIGSALIPPLTDLAEKGTRAVNAVAAAFGNLSPAGQQTVLVIAGVAAAIGPVTFVLGSMVNGVARVIGAMKALRAATLAVRNAQLLTAAAYRAQNVAMRAQAAATAVARAGMMALRVALLAVRAVMLGMRVVAAAAFGPVGLAIMAVALIGVLVVKKWGAIKGALSAAWGAIKTAAASAFGLVKRAAMLGLLGPVALIISRWRSVLGALRAVWSALKSAAGAAFKAVAGVVRKGLELAVAAVRGYVGAYKAAGLFVFKGVAAGIRAVVGAVKGAASFVVHAAVAIVKGALGAAKSAAGAIGRGIAAGIRGAAGAVKGAASAVVHGAANVVRGAIGWATEAGKAIIRNMAGGVAAMAGALVGAVKGLLKKVRDQLPGSEPKDGSSPLAGLADAGAAAIRNFAGGVASQGGHLRNATATAFETFLDPLTAELAGLQALSGNVQAEFDRIDSARERAGLAGRAGGRLRKVPHGGNRRTTGKGLNSGQRHRNATANRRDDQARDRALEHNKRIKDARGELAKFDEAAARSQRLAAIQLRVDGLERLKAANDALATVQGSLKDASDAAAAAFREARETAIDANLQRGLAAFDPRQAKRAGVAVDAETSELLALQQAEKDAATAKEDRENQSALGTAQAALARAQLSQSPRLIADAQAQVNDAMGAIEETARQRRMDALQSSIADRQQALQDTADDQKSAVDGEVAVFQSGLDAQLGALMGSLQQRQLAYQDFVGKVQAILAPLGGQFAGDADVEQALTPPGAATEPTSRKPAPKKKRPAKKKHRASGGLQAIAGAVTRVGEFGPEDVYLPAGSRVTPAAQSAPGGRPIYLRVENHGQQLDELQLAARLGYQLETRGIAG